MFDLRQIKVSDDVTINCVIGGRGRLTMARHFDILVEWRKRCAYVKTATLPGGHFFVDQFPRETADVLMRFLQG